MSSFAFPLFLISSVRVFSPSSLTIRSSSGYAARLFLG
jgi:hypothetical protein